MNYGREDRNLFKGVLYIYLAAMCYYKRSMVTLTVIYEAGCLVTSFSVPPSI